MKKETGILLRERNKHLIGRKTKDGSVISDLLVVPTNSDVYKQFFQMYHFNDENWEVIKTFPEIDVELQVFYDYERFRQTGVLIMDRLEQIVNDFPDIILSIEGEN